MRVLKALVISLFVYALLLWLFIVQYNKLEKRPIPKNKHVIKIDIKNMPLPPSKPAPKAPVPKPVIKPKVPKKPKVVQKPVKKKVIKKTPPKKKKVIKKKVVKKKVIKKTPPKKRVLVKKTPSKKRVVKEKSKALKKFEEEMVYIPEPMLIEPKKSQTQSNDLGSFLSVPQTPMSAKAYPNPKIRKLYGAEFHQFTPKQKKFIKDNLNTIQQITQRTLTRRGYPEGAGRTGQQGTNVVSFNLHPNGNISNLRLKTRIGYRALDENTLTLIKVAYKDYPYPSTTTKIVFYVTYSIYGY